MKITGVDACQVIICIGWAHMIYIELINCNTDSFSGFEDFWSCIKFDSAGLQWMASRIIDLFLICPHITFSTLQVVPQQASVRFWNHETLSGSRNCRSSRILPTNRTKKKGPASSLRANKANISTPFLPNFQHCSSLKQTNKKYRICGVGLCHL